MVFTTLLLLAVIFLAGLINILFVYFPKHKLLAKFHSLFQIQTATNKDVVTTRNVGPPQKNRVVRTEADADHAELKRVFATFDKNSDGFITKQELKDSLKNIKIFLSDQEVDEMMAKVDANGDGLIDFAEFCSLCTNQGIFNGNGAGEMDQEEELKEAFDVFDKDNDGLISVEELGVVLCSLGLREGNKLETCKEMVKKVDKDGDGMVNFDEFKMMMKGGRLIAAH